MRHQSGLPTPNGQITRLTYDGLGRLSKVFLPANAGAYPDGVPSTEYTYTQTLRTRIDQTFGTFDQPTRVKTTTLKDKANGSAAATTTDAYAFYDGWGRAIETQAVSPTSGQRVVTSTGYDERGLPRMASAAYAVSGTFETVVNPAPATLARLPTTTVYIDQLTEISRTGVDPAAATRHASTPGAA
jgi:hypothetical protein